MLIKWITCKVSADQKAAFSVAQEQWKTIKAAKGFIAQFGGWSQYSPNEASILAFWHDYHCYQEFMLNIHDEIFDNNQQRGTYEEISVNLYSKKNLLEVANSFLYEKSFIRVDEFVVRDEPVLEEDWNDSNIVFCRHQTDPDRYLGIALARNSSHIESVPFFIGESEVNVTRLITLNPSWTV